MSLSFREQAAIALSASRDANAAVKDAQALADVVCEAWGHDYCNERKDCRRCGAKGLPR